MASADLEALARTAATLGRRAAGRKGGRKSARGLPALLFFTDPDRTPDPVAVALRLPRGAGVVFRGFGHPGAEAVAERLVQVARRRGLVLLIGADPTLAARVGAAGVHLPERSVAQARRLRARHPSWLLTVAAHSARALVRAREAGADAAVLSPVFPSRSLSAGRPLGPVRFAALVRGARLPVYALGGVEARTARRLLSSGAVGLAAVEGVAGKLTN